MYSRAFLVFLILILSTLIYSHQRSESYSRIEIENNEEAVFIEIDFNVQISVLSKIKSTFDKSWESNLQEEILNNYKIEGPCQLDQGPYFRSSLSTGYVSLRWRQSCKIETVEIIFSLFYSQDPSHVHIATMNIDGQPYPEKIFTVSSKRWNESSSINKEEASAYSSFYDYLMLGIKHICLLYTSPSPRD